MSYRQMKKERPLALYQGIFRCKLTLAQGVALIISGTFGAGVLGVPFVVARVGIVIGIIYIILLGLLMMSLNLLIGEVATCTKQELQIAGLARTYLGVWGGRIMAVLIYVMALGVLVVYIIGEGSSLAALFGGDAFMWSIIFFAVASICVALGLRMLKVAGLFLSLGLLFVIIIISVLSTPHISISYMQHYNFAYMLFPYGVILFSFSSTGVIPEAHALLNHKDGFFKKAIMIASAICISMYALFALVVVGVTGLETTAIATIGLGNVVGKTIFVFGNVFAVIAMGAGFLMSGVALRDSLQWDYKVPAWAAPFVVCGIPFVIFIAGLRNFIELIDIIGGVLVSIELIGVTLIYWRARQKGLLHNKRYHIHHALWLVVILLIAFAVGAGYSVVKLF